MTIQIINSCAGTTFMYSKGDVVSSDSAPIERLKDLVKGGHAFEITPVNTASGNKHERVEKR